MVKHCKLIDIFLNLAAVFGVWTFSSDIKFLIFVVTCFASLFFKQEMELSLVGLQNAGKTSLVNAIAVSKNPQRFLSCIFQPNLILTRLSSCFLQDWRLQWRYDTNSWIQHEESYKRKRYHKDLGSWRTTKVSYHVGALLPWSVRHCV